jgi:hypothetical protein
MMSSDGIGVAAAADGCMGTYRHYSVYLNPARVGALPLVREVFGKGNPGLPGLTRPQRLASERELTYDHDDRGSSEAAYRRSPSAWLQLDRSLQPAFVPTHCRRSRAA